MAEPIFVVLYCDADVTPKLARLLRELGFDAVSTYEVGNMELTDAEQLAYAVNHGGRSSPITAKISRRSSINTGGKAESTPASLCPSNCRWVNCCAGPHGC